MKMDIGLLTCDEFYKLQLEIINNKNLCNKVDVNPIKGSNGRVELLFDDELENKKYFKKLIEEHCRPFRLAYSPDENSLKKWC